MKNKSPSANEAPDWLKYYYRIDMSSGMFCSTKKLNKFKEKWALIQNIFVNNNE